MKWRFCKCLIGATAVCAILTAVSAHAAPIVLTPTEDTFVSAATGERDTNFNGQNISVRPSPSSGRAALIQFDLSSLAGMTITDAYLRVFQFDDTGNTTAFTNSSYFLTYANGSGGLDASTATWNDYGSPLSEDQVTNFGVLTIPAASASGQYYESAHANVEASELAYIQGRIDMPNAVDQILAMQLWRANTTSGTRLFGDTTNVYSGDNMAHPIQLVVEVVPEPSSILIAGLGMIGTFILRRRAPALK